MSVKTRTCNRREFFSKSAAGVASLGLLGLPRSGASRSKELASSGQKKNMVFRTLGGTGIEVPVVSMGVMNSDNPDLVRRAYESGIRHFDTAASYARGKNEEMVGKVIRELGVRDKVYIATKVPRIQPPLLAQMKTEEVKAHFLQHFAKSLERLQTDYVDMIYLHDASGPEYVRHPGFLSAMEQVKKEKRARHSGFSIHAKMPECLNAAVQDGFYEVILVAWNYSLGENTKLLKSLENAAAKGIGLIAMKTQCKQDWFREFEPFDDKRFYSGESMNTALLKWVLRHPFITTAVPGFQTFQELEEDLSVAFNLDYTPEEKKFLEDRNVKLALGGVCTQCYACTAACPRGVDIPSLMRTHMYAACYANFHEARTTLTSIPEGQGLDQCASCSRCRAVCARRVDIARRIDHLKVIFA
jgi:predicted aldo/keto reductase-like oxidoreductase